MSWLPFPDSKLPEGTLVVCSGFIDESEEKGRWYSTAIFEGGVFADQNAWGEPLYTPTHYQILEKLG